MSIAQTPIKFEVKSDEMSQTYINSTICTDGRKYLSMTVSCGTQQTFPTEQSICIPLLLRLFEDQKKGKHSTALSDIKIW